MKTLRTITAICLLCGTIGCSTVQTAPRTAVYNTRLVYAETETPIITALAGGRAALHAEIRKSMSIEERDPLAEGAAGRISRVQQLFRIQTPLVRAAERKLLDRGYTAVVPCNLDGNTPAGRWVDATEQMVTIVNDLIKEDANNLLDTYLPEAGDGLWKNGQQ